MCGFGDFLVKEGLWQSNPLRWMRGPKLSLHSHLPKRIDREHMEAIWREAAQITNAFSRHLWVTSLALLYGSGLRRGELERLDVSALDRAQGTLRVDGRKTGYANQNPLRFTDPEGLKPYIFRVTVGGGVSLPGTAIAGQVFNLAVGDPRKGETCNYTVTCLGAGWSYRGTPSFGAGAHVKWDDGKDCSDCRQFAGSGLSGSLGFQFGPIGYTPVDWLEVPNGPRLDFSGWSAGQFNVGGGTFHCRFSL